MKKFELWQMLKQGQVGLLRDDSERWPEIWQLFDYERDLIYLTQGWVSLPGGHGESGWAAVYNENWTKKDVVMIDIWCAGLMHHCSEKGLDALILYDSILDSLAKYHATDARKFPDYRTGVLDRIKMEPEQLVARKPKYLALLAGEDRFAAEWGLKMLHLLVGMSNSDKQSQCLLIGEVAPYVVPVFGSKFKPNPMQALELLDRIAANAIHPEETVEAAILALEALRHQSSEVRDKAIELILKYGQTVRNNAALFRPLGAALERVTGAAGQRLSSLVSEGPDLTGAAPAANREAITQIDIDDVLSIEQRAMRDSLVARGRAIPSELAISAGIANACETLSGRGPGITSLPLDSGFPRLNPDAVLQPLQNIDELMYRCLQVLEAQGTGEDLELVIDGLARLCGECPDDFDRLVAPLRARALAYLANKYGLGDTRPCPLAGKNHREDLAALVLAWTDGIITCPNNSKRVSHNTQSWHWNQVSYETPWGTWFENVKQPHLLTFFSKRVREVANFVVERQGRVLLSTPTHRGGWIDPRVFAHRAKELIARGKEFIVADSIQSMLRLAPEHRSEALSELAKVSTDGETDVLWAFRYALGDEDIPDSILSKCKAQAAIWVAASRARAPRGVDCRIPSELGEFGPDTIGPAVYEDVPGSLDLKSGGVWACRAEALLVAKGPVVDSEEIIYFPTVLFHRKFLDVYALNNAGLAVWEPLVWPQHRQSYFAAEARLAAQYQDSQGMYWQSGWEPLFDPDVPADGTACWLIALALCVRHAQAQLSAVDALIQTVEETRLNVKDFGHALSVLSQSRTALSRLLANLQSTSQLSALHLLTLSLCLEQALACLLGKEEATPPTKLLELMRELFVQGKLAVTDEQARSYLTSLVKSGSRKYKNLASSLLALEADPRRQTEQSAALQALSHRILRAERWKQWLEPAPNLMSVSGS